MELVKIVQARFLIENDLQMYDDETDTPAVAKTSSLNDELGMVEFIFSDKTGTLTQNVMDFLKFTVNGIEYGRGTTEIGRAAAKRNNVDLHDDRPQDWKPSVNGFHFYDERILDGKWKQEECAEQIRAFFTVLAVCHTVIPEHSNGEVIYQASSPDEAALVKAASILGVQFYNRSRNTVTIRIGEQEESFQILNELEFTSERKRMSVIVKTPDDRILLMTKGADNVIYERMNTNDYTSTTQKSLNKFAQEGLRTLVVAQCELDPEKYHEWHQKVFLPASLSISHTKEQELANAAELIETGLELVGATAIEDKLQVNVAQTIEELAQAGIKMWVLTGDKQETAINIGFACALLDNQTETIILNQTDRNELKREIRTMYKAHLTSRTDREMALVIDGFALDLILSRAEQASADTSILDQSSDQITPLSTISEKQDKPSQEEPLHITFLKLCMMCKSVICCRVSPLQKALVVKLVKDVLNGPITLAIGDGANDVSMIQAAHIGVGISGKEGLQAARASDYAIAQFRFLKPLLFVHGRYNYRRISRVICHSFYKNLTLQFCQFWYVWFNAYTGTSVLDINMLILFNAIFTSVPIIAYGVTDRDVSKEASLNVPELYIYGQRGHYVSCSSLPTNNTSLTYG
jgi:magnesium-transporting ATPase (P-type)